MNIEDKELCEIEKMLGSIQQMEPSPELRASTLSQARKKWHETKNFSNSLLLWIAAVALFIFSIGYFVGKANTKSSVVNSEDEHKVEESLKKESIGDRVLKGGK